jgi:hypothetical protein
MVSSDPNDMSHGMYRGKACQAFGSGFGSGFDPGF